MSKMCTDNYSFFFRLHEYLSDRCIDVRLLQFFSRMKRSKLIIFYQVNMKTIRLTNVYYSYMM